jgi:hypothetical protein
LKIMRTIHILAAAILTAAIAAPAIAQQQTTFTPGGVFALPPKERFAATDKNKDGKIQQDEYKAVLNPEAAQFIDAIWERLDANKDGTLSEPEMNPQPSSGFGRGRGGPPPAPVAAPQAK